MSTTEEKASRAASGEDAAHRRRSWRWVGPVAVLVVAAVLYPLIVPVTGPNMDSMKVLVIQDPGIAALKSTPAHQGGTDPAKSAFPGVKRAAARQPDQTGSYGIEWVGKKAANDVGSMLVYLLPTSAQAAAANRQAVAQYVTGPNMAKNGFTLVNKFSVPGVTGATGATYRVTNSSANASTSTTSTAFVVLFAFQRTSVVEYLQSTDGALSQNDAVKMAQGEHAQLVANEPGFTLEQTTWPLWSSILFWAVAVLLAVAVWVVPGLVRRYRERRARHEEDRRRSQYRTRGAKTVRRQRAPSWAQRR